jgi:hypothetical protein
VGTLKSLKLFAMARAVAAVLVAVWSLTGCGTTIVAPVKIAEAEKVFIVDHGRCRTG